jgi:ethanolamine ammonia-lyase small subunit
MVGWHDLRRYTPARVGLGLAGRGLPTAAHLAFQGAHAAARDAVHAALDLSALQAALPAQAVVVASQCPDRQTYLLRPDLGRRLAAGTTLVTPPAPPALACVICDGLSAIAAQRHAPALLHALWPHLNDPPLVIAQQGRVAIGDEIAERLGADAVVVLIGERPGLSAPDSLGAYLTWQPRIGRNDAERNCISNIRPEGLGVSEAAGKLLWLIGQMRAMRLTGVALKDEQPMNLPLAAPFAQMTQDNDLP